MKYADANDSVRRKWNLHLGPWLSFEEAKSTSKYKSMQHFAAMLKRNGYPKALLKEQFITQAALEYALKLESKQRQKQKSENRQKQP